MSDKAMQGASCPKEEEFAMGGQAVLEGVMMRGPKSYAVAVRRPQGNIVMLSKTFIPVVKRHKWLRLPIVRGAVSLIEMMLLGYKTLEYSANVAEAGYQEMEEEEKRAAQGEEAGEPLEASTENAKPTQQPEKAFGGWQMAGIFMVSMAFAMLLFVVLPNYTTHLIGKLLPYEKVVEQGVPLQQSAGKATDANSGLVEVNHPFMYNIVSGGVRIIIIVGYIWLISLMQDIRRLFQYHGAEHKVVMAHEMKLPLDLEHIRPVTTLHPRCGTTFIAIVILVSILFFAVLTAAIMWQWPNFAEVSFWVRKPALILMHIVLMPVVAGVAYEVTRRAGRNSSFWLYRILLAPGYAFQKITTREPDDSMIEVALTAFNEALEPSQIDDEPILS